MRTLKTFLFCAVIVCASPFAFSEDGDEGGRVLVATNALGIVTLNPNADVEYLINDSLSVGATVWFEVRDVEDRYEQLKVTYHPLSRGFRGLNASATGGFHQSYDGDDFENIPTVGALLGWNWTGGRLKRWDVGLESGVTYLIGNDREITKFDPWYIEARVFIGYVF